MLVQYLPVHIGENSTQHDWAVMQQYSMTSFPFMNPSKPYIYSDVARYYNCEITPNLMHL